jgi:hypothetical protein
MTTQIYEGPAIMVGYAYKLRLEAEGALFPQGAVFVGQVRTKVAADQVLITLSTEAGSFVRISDQELDLTITATETAALSVGSVVVDVVRTDLDPDLHLGFALEIPVMLPVTRGLS